MDEKMKEKIYSNMNIRTKKWLLGLVLCGMMYGVCAQQSQKQESKFVYMSSLGFNSGFGNIRIPDKSVPVRNAELFLQQLLAYQFNNYVFTGIGAGINIWKRTAFIPIYASVHVNFIDRKTSPHWYLNVGYSFKWYMKTEPETLTRVIHGASTGLYGESGLGVKVKVSDKFSMMAVVNYMLQQSTIRYSVVESGEPDYSAHATNRSQTALYHFVGFKVGFLY
jgi:hypothetical protein